MTSRGLWIVVPVALMLGAGMTLGFHLLVEGPVGSAPRLKGAALELRERQRARLARTTQRSAREADRAGRRVKAPAATAGTDQSGQAGGTQQQGATAETPLGAGAQPNTPPVAPAPAAPSPPPTSGGSGGQATRPGGSGGAAPGKFYDSG